MNASNQMTFGLLAFLVFRFTLVDSIYEVTGNVQSRRQVNVK
ncbi:MAG TPA: hypothetical protein PKZ24_05425 [Nitrospirales bacterium]|nr:hypothetical protein [Nitrospirales bacterium]